MDEVVNLILLFIIDIVLRRTKMGQYYYVSDYHFFHELALKRSRPEFNDIKEMNKEIVNRHNQKVTENDHIYILGDIIVCEENELERCLTETVDLLKGHLHLVVGNHDMKFRHNPIFESRFETINDALWLKDWQKGVQLFHYPILMWHRKGKGAYHIYGHLHNEIKGQEIRLLANEANALNACVEINHYEPCQLEELIINNSIFKDKLLGVKK